MADSSQQKKSSDKKHLRININKLGIPSESVRKLGKTLKGINGQFDAKSIGLSQGLLDRIASACGAFNGVDERMKSVSKLAGHSSAFGKLADQIAKQQGLVDSLKLNSPDLEDVLKNNSDHLSKLQPESLPKIPPNPGIETNQRLENIEKRFDQLYEVAIGAADIANGLQGAATEFLVKFESAAQDNNNAATKAIWLGAMAVFATLVVALVPIAYNEYFRVPADTKAMQAAIVEMKLEFTALREQQNNDITGLVEALNKSEDNLADAILQLKKLLSEKEHQKGN